MNSKIFQLVIRIHIKGKSCLDWEIIEKYSKEEYVFVCHACDDDIIADKIYNFLQANGIRCWIDHKDGRVGEPWEDYLVPLIKNTDLFILLLSKNSIESEDVKRELSIAFKKKIKILPIILDSIVLKDRFEYYLTGIQQYFAVKEPIEEHLNNILQEIFEKIRM